MAATGKARLPTEDSLMDVTTIRGHSKLMMTLLYGSDSKSGTFVSCYVTTAETTLQTRNWWASLGTGREYMYVSPVYTLKNFLETV